MVAIVAIFFRRPAHVVRESHADEAVLLLAVVSGNNNRGLAHNHIAVPNTTRFKATGFTSTLFPRLPITRSRSGHRFAAGDCRGSRRRRASGMPHDLVDYVALFHAAGRFQT